MGNTLPEGNRNTLPEGNRNTLPEMEDGPDSWFNDPRITEDSRNIRLRARAYRQNNAYRRDPNNFNRREWRQRDEARMREMQHVDDDEEMPVDDDEMPQDDVPVMRRIRPRQITPQSVQAESENEDATRLEVFERGGQVLLRRNRELPQQRITIPRIVPPTSQNNRAEPYTLDLDSDSSSDSSSDDDDTLLPIQPYESDVPSNFARQEI